MTTKKFLFCTFGTLGDINPLLYTATALQQQGAEAVMVLNPDVAELGISRELRVISTATPFNLDEFIQQNPDLITLQGGRKIWDQCYLLQVTEQYQTCKSIIEQEPIAAVVIHPLCIGAAWAALEHQIPLVNTHCSPASLRSSIDPAPLTHWDTPPWLTRQLNRALHWGFNRYADATLKPLAQQLAIGFNGRSIEDCFTAAQLELCFWPEQFRPATEDDPSNTRYCGFPWSLTAQPEPAMLSQACQDFLKDHPNPVVVSLGSSMRNLETRLTDHISQACAALDQPCILVTKQHDHRPRANLLVSPYEDYPSLFPYASVIVHHGGIGTSAAALASGKPALVIPFFADQFDNANRLQRLNAGRRWSLTKATKPNAAQPLSRLLHDVQVDAAIQANANRWQPLLAAWPNGAAIAAKTLLENF